MRPSLLLDLALNITESGDIERMNSYLFFFFLGGPGIMRGCNALFVVGIHKEEGGNARQ